MYNPTWADGNQGAGSHYSNRTTQILQYDSLTTNYKSESPLTNKHGKGSNNNTTRWTHITNDYVDRQINLKTTAEFHEQRGS